MLRNVVAHEKRLCRQSQYSIVPVRAVASINIQDKNAHGYTCFANSAGTPAFVGRVVGCLCCKGREPDEGEEAIKRGHDIWLGKLSCPRESRRHGEIDPCRNGEEALRRDLVSR